MLPRVFAFCAWIVASFAPRAVSACDCPREVLGPAQAFEAAAFVAFGRVDALRSGAFDLVVERTEKGAPRGRGERRAVVEIRNEGGSCGERVRAGEALLVYAGEAEGRLYVRQCSATRVVRGEAARRELEARAWGRP